MELRQQQEFYSHSNRGQVELAVFDFVGQLLAITLEKYDVEVLIESNDFLYDQENGFEFDSALKTIIDCEEVVETGNAVEITLSGKIENSSKAQETFVLFCSLSWNDTINASLKNCNEKGLGTKTIRLQFGRKVEQLLDSVFRVKLYCKELHEQLHDLDCGKGFLVFGREKISKSN